ncbi:hypothetical protein HanIR_Chr14g0678501 [Helianthus annuus]|nr:hypothetical protein HanIR_Chr14g0678501 [Helianthus annuus]
MNGRWKKKRKCAVYKSEEGVRCLDIRFDENGGGSGIPNILVMGQQVITICLSFRCGFGLYRIYCIIRRFHSLVVYMK